MGFLRAMTASNGGRIKKDKEAEVRKLINKYEFSSDLLCAIYDGRIMIRGEDWPFFSLKQSNKKEQVGHRKDVFEEFLQELAPLLAEDLVIHAAGTEKCDFPIVVMELKVTSRGLVYGGEFKWLY